MDIINGFADYAASLPRRRPASVGALPWSFLDDFRASAPAAAPGRPCFAGEWPSLAELFEITVFRHGGRRFLSMFEGDRRLGYDYRGARALVAQNAARLVALGVVPGDRVAVSGKNSPAWAVAWLAAVYADAVVVPIDVALKPAEAANLLKASGAKVLVADRDRLEAIAAEPAGAGQAPATLCLEPGPDCILDSAGFEPPPPPRRGRHDAAAIMFTSGTTGDPKGVVLSHDNLVSDIFLAQYQLPIYHSDVFYALLPIHHSYTMLAVFLEAMGVGAEIVFGQKMVVGKILQDLDQAGVTMFLGVPMLFNRVLAGIVKKIKERGPAAWAAVRLLMGLSGAVKKAFGVNPGRRLFRSILDQASLGRIRICISGGGPLPAETFRRFNQLGIDFVQGYGLTETSPIIALNPTWRYKEESVGALIPGIELRIDAPDARGQGEIVVRGPVVTRGYHGAAGGALEIDGQGWLHTGDVGWLDGEGYLYLTGRAKNVIVTEGGKNVYPEEIENAFQLYPEIEQVLVRGYVLDESTRAEGIEVLVFPNREQLKEKPKGFDLMAHIQGIVNEVNAHLAGYMKINRSKILDEPMEMTTTRKIRRFSVKPNQEAS